LLGPLTDEGVDGHGGAAVLHRDRHEPGVQRPGLEQLLDHARPQPRIEVVHVRLELQGGGGGPVRIGGQAVPGDGGRRLLGRGRATRTRTTFGRPGVSLVPAPTPSASVVIIGCGPDEAARPRSRATPVGVASSPMPGATPAGIRRPPCSCGPPWAWAGSSWSWSWSWGWS